MYLASLIDFLIFPGAAVPSTWTGGGWTVMLAPHPNVGINLALIGDEDHPSTV